MTEFLSGQKTTRSWLKTLRACQERSSESLPSPGHGFSLGLAPGLAASLGLALTPAPGGGRPLVTPLRSLPAFLKGFRFFGLLGAASKTCATARPP